MDARKKIVSIASVAVMAAAGLSPLGSVATAQSEERDRSASWVTIRYGNSARKFKGTVGSRNMCQRFRKVLVKKQRPGRNTIVGKDTTSRQGNWKVHRRHHPGRYYAMVAPKTVTTPSGEKMDCRWDRSVTIKI